LFHDGKWLLPLDATPTSHIFKVPLGMLPNGIDLSTSVENEWLCLKLASHLGLPVPHVSMASFEDCRCLIVERFDRQWSNDGTRIIRLPQEDLCQALGIPSIHKYECDTGPGIKQVMDFLDASDVRDNDRALFFKAQIISFLIGATDGHAKNFSIFIRPSGFRLTPFYDILSVVPALNKRQIERKDVKLAMSVGYNHHDRIYEIQYRHWQQEAKKAGFAERFMTEIIEDVLCRLEKVDSVLNSLPEDYPSNIVEGLFKFARKQAVRLKPVKVSSRS